MHCFVSALLLGAPAVQEAPAEPLSNRVLLLEPGAEASIDATASLDAIEAHAGGSGLVFGREAATGAPLKVALERSRNESLLAIFWFETSNTRVSLYLYAPRTHAVYVRDVEREGTTEATVVEAVGLIAASTAEALRTGEVLSMRKISDEELEAMQRERDPAPAPADDPTIEEPPVEEPRVPEATPSEVSEDAPGPQVELGVGYRGASFNRVARWQHGVGGRVGIRLGGGLMVELGYGWLAQADIAASTTLRLVRHEPEVGAGWRWDFGRTLLDVLGSVSVEIDRWRLEGRGSTRLRGRLGGFLRPGVELGAGVVLEARLGARVGLNAFDFVVCESPQMACSGDARAVVAEAWRVAPEALVGFSYRFGASSAPSAKK